MHRFWRCFWACVLLVCAATAAHANGFSVVPTRAVIDARQTAAAFTIINDDPAQAVTYRIALVDQIMTAQGAVRSLAAGEEPPPGWRSARPYLRLSPAQVTLGPGQTQTIRLAWRPPADIVAGEYRAHLMVSALPPPEPEAGAGATGFSIKLRAINAVTVPVIVRVGAVDAAPMLQNLSFVAASGSRGPSLRLDLARRGEASVAGDISVIYVPPGAGRAEEIGQIRRVATYTELSARPVVIALTPPRGGFAAGGRLIARMYADLDRRGMPLAEAEASTP